MTWRPRWNLRIFLGFILIAGWLAGMQGRREMQRRCENAAVQTLSSSGVQFKFGDDSYSRTPGANHDGGAVAAYVYEQNNDSDNAIDLSQLRQLTHLKTLHFGCKSIPPDAIRHLERLATLEELHLSYFPIDDAILESIAKISSLKRLRLDNAQITTKGIEHLVALKQLSHLDIQTMNQPADGLEGAGKYLGQMTTLKELNLKANLTDDDLLQLSKLEHLRELSLTVPQLKAKHMAGFVNCPHLETLSIYNVNGDNDMLEAISTLSGLKFFSCGLGRADDDGLHHLTSLKKLEKIELGHSAATEKAVEVLNGLPHLRQIQLRYPKTRGGWIPGPKGKRPPWPEGSGGSGIFERTDGSEFKEMTNEEIDKRGYW